MLNMEQIKGLWSVSVTKATLSSLLLQPVVSLHSLLGEICLFIDTSEHHQPSASASVFQPHPWNLV